MASNGKELARTQQWEHRSDRIHRASQRQLRRTPTNNGSATLKNRQERWLLRQLKVESRTAAEVVIDDALEQDDGIDLTV